MTLILVKRRCCWRELEVGAAVVPRQDDLREAGRQEPNLHVRPQSGSNNLRKHSYWLDLWLFILFDVVVFLFVYFWP
ncbi:uncharacterized protein C4orf3-like [Nycticebus coucang]|uniref:uncharacterized protein C4orf3-like n=1 Tax=Nycticebus coucang TaxID=9470 RepID=UPI00234C5BD4|nr:uncharacterized protein C4orf3-like [Nycticebus coucang]